MTIEIEKSTKTVKNRFFPEKNISTLFHRNDPSTENNKNIRDAGNHDQRPLSPLSHFLPPSLSLSHTLSLPLMLSRAFFLTPHLTPSLSEKWWKKKEATEIKLNWAFNAEPTVGSLSLQSRRLWGSVFKVLDCGLIFLSKETKDH